MKQEPTENNCSQRACALWIELLKGTESLGKQWAINQLIFGTVDISSLFLVNSPSIARKWSLTTFHSNLQHLGITAMVTTLKPMNS